MQSGSAADGSYLLAVDDGDKRTLVVWEWRSRRLIARTVVSRSFLFRQSKPLGVSARPLTDELDPSICSHLSERHTNSQKLETWPSLRLCPARPPPLEDHAPGPTLERPCVIRPFQRHRVTSSRGNTALQITHSVIVI